MMMILVWLVGTRDLWSLWSPPVYLFKLYLFPLNRDRAPPEQDSSGRRASPPKWPPLPLRHWFNEGCCVEGGEIGEEVHHLHHQSTPNLQQRQNHRERNAVLKITLSHFFFPKKSFVWVTLAFLSLPRREISPKNGAQIVIFFSPFRFYPMLSLPASPCFLNKRREREREQGKLICLDSSFYLKPATLPPTMINLCFPQDNNVGHFSGLLLTLT